MNNKRLYFLDGLRGWGSLIVLLDHIFCSLPVSEKSTQFLAFIPFFNGKLAVWVFFIVSGFSLSIGYCLNKNEPAVKRICLGRYFRLTIPILIISLIIISLFGLGLFPSVDHRPPSYQAFLAKAPSLWETIRCSIYGVYFDSTGQTIIPPLWTMSYEFWGSCLVLCSLLIIGNLPYRIFIYGIIFIVTYYIDMFPYYTAFFVGLLFAEIYSEQLFPRIKNLLPLAAKLLIVPAIYLCCKLSQATINAYLIASVLLCFCLIFNPITEKLLSSSLSVFLGKISYCLYLSHVTILYIFTINFYHILQVPSGFSATKLFINLLTVGICLLSAYLLVPVDRMSIKMAKSFANLFFKPKSPTENISNSAELLRG